MPKLRLDPITATDLKRFLGSDDDFAFELRCLSSLSQRPIKLEHGGTYSDPVTNKTRQFDIRARIEADPLRVSLAIECKNLSLSYPLLVSRVPRLEGEAFHHLLIQEEEDETAVGVYRTGIRKLSASKSVAIKAPLSVYETSAFVGKSVTRVGVAVSANGEFVSDDSEVFDRWSQAVASAHELMSAANTDLAKEECESCAYWIVPLLVVPQGTLWVADYDSKGSLLASPKTIDEVEIYLDHYSWQRGQMFSYTISHLHFVTPEGMLKLVDRIITNTHYRGRILPANLPEED